MKRCPQCNRVETDEALKFCRADGATLVNDSSSIAQEAGTAKLGSSAPNDDPTTIFPLKTEETVPRHTAPTTVLPPNASRATHRTKSLTIVPIAMLIIAGLVVAISSYRSSRSGTAIQSISVMPFVNEGGNADVEYLSDGMTETLISSLSQLSNLNVKARASVFRYKDKETNPQTIGKELNVQAILNGRVAQRGDQLTLTLELVDTQTENVIWSEQYNRKQADLVALQSEIARDVSSKLKSKLSGADQAKLMKS